MNSVFEIQHELAALEQGIRDLHRIKADVDYKELGIDDGSTIREEDALEDGSLMKAEISAGIGDTSPEEGDMVFVHVSMFGKDTETPCMTTRQEKNGHGTPAVFVLCKGSSRPLRGVELAILSMKKHEKCLIELKPEMGLMHDEVKHSSMGSMFASQWKDKNSALRVYIELIDWLPRATTHLSEDGFEGIKHVIKDGEGWETPRVPFHVSITCQVREVSASDGMLKQGALLSFPIPQLGAKDVHNFSLGEGVFPPVVESCISSMHSQEECVFYCPETCMSSWLERKEDADKDSIHIPRFIEFQIKLMDFLQVRDVMGDGQVTKRVIQRGTGEFPIDCPLEDTSVKVRMRVRERSSSSESLEKAWYPFYMNASMNDVIEFCTGMGEVPDCIDQSVRLMLPGEVCVVHASVEGHLDSNDNINIEHLNSKIPSGKAEIEMKLLGFEQAKYAENMSPAEKLARATSLKEQGNALYRNGKTKYARMKYNKALNLVGKAYEFGEEEMRSIDIKVSCMLNLAACAQADTSYGEAIDWCNKVIEEYSENPKAYFRRAKAKMSLGNYEDAVSDLNKVLEVDPSFHEDIKKEKAILAKRAKAASMKQRQEFANFFGKKV